MALQPYPMLPITDQWVTKKAPAVSQLLNGPNQTNIKEYMVI